MKWNPHWDLTTIPEEVFQSEYGRRNALKREYVASCGHTEPDPENCTKCRQRLYRRDRRAQGKDLAG